MCVCAFLCVVKLVVVCGCMHSRGVSYLLYDMHTVRDLYRLYYHYLGGLPPPALLVPAVNKSKRIKNTRRD